MNNQQNNQTSSRHVQTILVREQRYKSNGLGTAGFITLGIGMLFIELIGSAFK